MPNEALITQRVENLSDADLKFNVTTNITVGYDSDVAEVQRILSGAAAAQPRVLTQPAPVAFLVNFAPDGLEFSLNFWISDPAAGSLSLRSAINIAILDGLRAAGIAKPVVVAELGPRVAAKALKGVAATDATREQGAAAVSAWADSARAGIARAQALIAELERDGAFTPAKLALGAAQLRDLAM